MNIIEKRQDVSRRVNLPMNASAADVEKIWDLLKFMTDAGIYLTWTDKSAIAVKYRSIDDATKTLCTALVMA